MPKTQLVEGVELASGFWWIIKREPEAVTLRNKRDQTMTVKPDRLAKAEVIRRRIKTSCNQDGKRDKMRVSRAKSQKTKKRRDSSVHDLTNSNNARLF